MTKSLLPVLLLLIFVQLKTSAQHEPTNHIFNLIYNQHYDSASVLLAQNNTIDDYYRAVLEIDLSYWKNVTGTNQPNYSAFEQTLNKYNIEAAETFHQKAIRLITLSYQLRYELKRFKIFNAISTRKKTLTLFFELKDHASALHSDQRELFDLYSALILYFDNYLKPFFSNDKDENMLAALTELEKLSSSSATITSTLSAYFLGKIYLSYEKQFDKGAFHFKSLSMHYPDNQKFRELYDECISKTTN
ncbi:hypothetical protein [Maribellus sp. YY47]|uniref:hypothetical protein n=1 Tax=Maribellus sp. YY47 TaxID=2929486 RepID=UPI00200162E2|nr:hypothetical protein [Maribellus sp. YY47]MCK3683671.1 hypothetical protein [Maribellus sp. YY47]